MTLQFVEYFQLVCSVLGFAAGLDGYDVPSTESIAMKLCEGQDLPSPAGWTTAASA
jgi:hypothetical protein